MSIDAMKQALEALEHYATDEKAEGWHAIAAITALRAAIEQAQEPVAWVGPSWLHPETRTWQNEAFSPGPIEGWTPLYTACRQWQGLTDKELEELSDADLGAYDLCLEVEAKLQEKNHG